MADAKLGGVQAELVRSALALARKKSFDHLLYVGDVALPDELIRLRTVRRKLVQAVTSETQRAALAAEEVRAITVPPYDLARSEKLKLALISGVTAGLFKHGDVVLALVGGRPVAWPDSIFLVTIGAAQAVEVGTSGWFGLLSDEKISTQVLGAVLDLAVSIAVEGWEGLPIGTLFVVGDAPAVMEKSRQLTLNPFQGYSEAEKNLLNPDVLHALRSFAVLDGAFVIREDGVVLAAGRYLAFDEHEPLKVPLGLGARHMAAAGITRETEAVAVVVSQTSGTVRVFRRGQMVLDLAPANRRVDGAPPSGRGA
jgi:DNA integrity scanning protein DisA with diadenylate cyclase activity